MKIPIEYAKSSQEVKAEMLLYPKACSRYGRTGTTTVCLQLFPKYSSAGPLDNANTQQLTYARASVATPRVTTDVMYQVDDLHCLSALLPHSIWHPLHVGPKNSIFASVLQDDYLALAALVQAHFPTSRVPPLRITHRVVVAADSRSYQCQAALPRREGFAGSR